MPGNKLNDVERKLYDWWSSNQSLKFPNLNKIYVYGRPGHPGIRGIINLKIEFRFPLTVICGKNGSGKSTLLALAVLGYHSPDNHYARDANCQNKKANCTYYTFSKFFYKGPQDPDITGAFISWDYSDGFIWIEKRSNKWMHYERRPRRPVHYIGVRRRAPAIEEGSLRYRFPSSSASNRNPLNEEYRKRLSDIMGREYESAYVLDSENYSVRTCNCGGFYSSFNMGTGEYTLIELLHILQETPEGSLIVVEEIELGLHPEAVAKLARHLQEIILIKKFQVVVSSHSEHFIDNVPRMARVLIEKAHTTHAIIYCPTTRFALGSMEGRSRPELKAYCEDVFSSILIQKSLSLKVRKRVEIIPLGSKNQLPEQAKFHVKGKFNEKIIIIWDGEVSRDEAKKWLNQDFTNDMSLLDKVNWAFLPGNEIPERWVINKLDCEEGYNLIAAELMADKTFVTGLIEKLKVERSHHDIFYRAAIECNIDKMEAINIFSRSVSRLSNQPLKSISIALEDVLEGKLVHQEIAI